MALLLTLVFFSSSHQFITEVCRKLTFFLTCEDNCFSSHVRKVSTHFNYIAIWMCARLVFEEAKPLAHWRDDNMIWAQDHVGLKKLPIELGLVRGSKWLLLKDTLPPQNVPHSPSHPLPSPANTTWKIKKNKTFCCYDCLKVFPSVHYLFSQFSRAGTVSWKGHKFSAFGLELAQSFLNAVFLVSRTWKTSNSHLEKLFSWQI